MLKTTNANFHEQEFYKIKAKRLESEIESLTHENSLLKMRLADANDSVQELRGLLESHRDSGRVSGNYHSNRESSSFASERHSVQRNFIENAEVEKLRRENRNLRNEHEMQIGKLKQENRRISRKLQQIQSETAEVTPQPTPRLAAEVERLERTNQSLRSEIEEFVAERRKFEQKIKVIDDNNRALRKENEDLRLKNSARDSAQEDMRELQRELKRLETLHNEEVAQLNEQIAQLQKVKNSEALRSSRFHKVGANPDAEQTESKDKANVRNDQSEREVTLLKRKMAILEESLREKDDEIKGVLLKLRPLLEKREGESGLPTENRASLSLLEVFLKKYKICSY